MNSAVILTAILGGLVFTYFVFRRDKKIRLPPSPPGLPFVGNWHQIDFFRMHIRLHEWAKRYGGVVMLRIFTERIVIFQDADVIREAFLSPEFSEALSAHRENFVARYVLPNDMIFQPYNHKTSLLKKTLTKGMKLYGTGLREVEALILQEVQHVADNFQSRDGLSFSPVEDIHNFLCRIVMILVTGRELPSNHESVKLIGSFDASLSYLSNPGLNAIIMLFPWLRHLPFGSGKVFRRISQNIRQLKALILKEEKSRVVM